jgi:glycosyltransferase involved in cell wall biosynthesis
VAVVICAYSMDRWSELAAAVRSCAEQTRLPDQVVVVIDHNDELLRRAKAAFENAIVVANRWTQGLSGARNTGVAVATSDTVAFMDDDAVADPEWLANLIAPLRDETVVGSGGWISPRWDTPPTWFPDEFRWVVGCSYPGLPASNGRVRNPIGANMVIRRHVFARVGGFSSGLGRVGRTPLGCEETELCIRYTERYPDERFVMAREAVVHHLVPAWRLTWRYFLARCWAEGISKAAVSSLVGSAPGLAAERHYMVRLLPRAAVRSLRMLSRHPVSAIGQITAVVAGTACAVAGWLRGTWSLRRHPIGLTEPDRPVPVLAAS